ncbi:methyltransferase domain-containing protein [Saccharopolyspora erythraea]|uniref:class I SAM-dependent methyltransferase n=1 Tax=Saccharopolyspora erythraea TaxID=1836 RepID=UPI001BA7242D|nr:class I SAM-dependent methyltransferase [Saccharopolyspora erythraea]QUG99663.1 methyltransferase domain-containing protein [Saccharopolyspora erythraea]
MTSSTTRGTTLVCHYRRDGITVPDDPRRCLRAQVRRIAGGRVLDIGAHDVDDLTDYRNACTLALAGATGPACERAKSLRLPGAEVEDGELDTLRFPQNAFDVVVLRFSLCRAAKPEQTLAEIGRVLRPNGHLVFLEHTRASGIVGNAQDRADEIMRGSGRCHFNHEVLQGMHRAGLVLRRAEWFWPSAHLRAPLVEGVASHPDPQYQRELRWLSGEQE